MLLHCNSIAVLLQCYSKRREGSIRYDLFVGITWNWKKRIIGFWPQSAASRVTMSRSEAFVILWLFFVGGRQSCLKILESGTVRLLNSTHQKSQRFERQERLPGCICQKRPNGSQNGFSLSDSDPWIGFWSDYYIIGVVKKKIAESLTSCQKISTWISGNWFWCSWSLEYVDKTVTYHFRERRFSEVDDLLLK